MSTKLGAGGGPAPHRYLFPVSSTGQNIHKATLPSLSLYGKLREWQFGKKAARILPVKLLSLFLAKADPFGRHDHKAHAAIPRGVGPVCAEDYVIESG
jgi:hypothetical protein